MTVKELLRDWLDNSGYVGLCNPDIECGCGIDDLVPCSNDCSSCQPAKIKKDGLFYVESSEE